MARYKSPAHHRAEAAFKKPPAEKREGLHEYEATQAAKLANMKRLRAERLARDAGSISLATPTTRRARAKNHG
jgi:hypothetical protein